MVSTYPPDIYEETVMEIASNGVVFDKNVLGENEVDISSLISDFYENGLSPFVASIELLRTFAFSWWCYLAVGSLATNYSDGAVNTLLEEVAGDKYVYDSDDDDGVMGSPIYDTIFSLDYDELRNFIKGCVKIKETL